MKKILLAVAVLLSLGIVSRADETSPKIMADFGQVKIYVPLTSVDSVYMWDFVGKQSLVGGETPLGSWKALTFTGGAVTSLGGEGTPFLGARLSLINPTEAWVPLAAVHPGLFAGRDFRNNSWVYGLKASVNIF